MQEVQYDKVSYEKGATGQKINPETNIDHKLTKITRHRHNPSQIPV